MTAWPGMNPGIDQECPLAFINHTGIKRVFEKQRLRFGALRKSIWPCALLTSKEGSKTIIKTVNYHLFYKCMSYANEGRANAKQTRQRFFNLEVRVRVIRKAKKTNKNITSIISGNLDYIFGRLYVI